jgi:hypothetical protein
MILSYLKVSYSLIYAFKKECLKLKYSKNMFDMKYTGVREKGFQNLKDYNFIVELKKDYFPFICIFHIPFHSFLFQISLQIIAMQKFS